MEPLIIAHLVVTFESSGFLPVLTGQTNGNWLLCLRMRWFLLAAFILILREGFSKAKTPNPFDRCPSPDHGTLNLLRKIRKETKLQDLFKANKETCSSCNWSWGPAKHVVEKPVEHFFYLVITSTKDLCNYITMTTVRQRFLLVDDHRQKSRLAHAGFTNKVKAAKRNCRFLVALAFTLQTIIYRGRA